MHTLLIGLNHKTAQVTIREKFYIPEAQIDIYYNELISHQSISGCVIVSTCNRFEIYASVHNINEATEHILQFIRLYFNIADEIIKQHLYIKRCQQAVIHLFKVTAGIDSMVIGEYQVQGQVRDAYTYANSIKVTDNYINKLFQLAINGGKRIRTETKIGKGTISVASLAIDFIKKNFPTSSHINILLVGSGKMATLTAKNLSDLTCSLTITNRSFDKAKEMALQFNATPVNFENRYCAIANNDVIIVATGGENYTITTNDLTNYLINNTTPKLFIDLSVPRNIEPSIINIINNCKLYTIDDLNEKINSNICKRSLEINKAEIIINQIADEYYTWYYKQIILPTMYEIKEKLAVLKEKCIIAYKNDFDSLTEYQQQCLKKILDTYSDKLTKVIMNNIKNVTSREDLLVMVEALRTSFNIDINLVDDLTIMQHQTN